MSERNEIIEALRKLANEVGGLRSFEDSIRAAIGHTNWGCLMRRLAEADRALAGTPAAVAPNALADAANALYDAGWWHCLDRKVDEAALWTALRDALGRTPGTSPAPAVAPTTLAEWIETDAGKAAIAEALRKSEQACAELSESRRVTPEMMNTPIGAAVALEPVALPQEPSTDFLVELSGELVRKLCEQICDDVDAISGWGGDSEDTERRFKAGISAACEEIKHRIQTMNLTKRLAECLAKRQQSGDAALVERQQVEQRDV